MTKFFKEPLVQFLLLGGMIFGLYAALDDSPPVEAKNAIVISQDDARRLVAEFEATWRRPPSEPELTEIIDETIREEVYVREALSSITCSIPTSGASAKRSAWASRWA
jgi:hypothetical protein